MLCPANRYASLITHYLFHASIDTMHTSKRCGDAVTIVVVWSCETSLELRINKRSQFPSRGIDPSLPRRAIYSSDASAPSLLHLFRARLSTTIARHTSHVTRHTSHVTRLRSLVTHHTSHVTRYPPALGFTAKMLIMQHSIGRQCFSRSATSALRSTISNCATSLVHPPPVPLPPSAFAIVAFARPCVCATCAALGCSRPSPK